MLGDVFVYARGAVRLSAVVSGMSPISSRCLIVIGGMTDGLLFAGDCILLFSVEFLTSPDFVEVIAARLAASSIATCSAMLSSSYMQFGMSSLEQDSTELDQLLDSLQVASSSIGVVLALVAVNLKLSFFSTMLEVLTACPSSVESSLCVHRQR
jgi:hypothetical protein